MRILTNGFVLTQVGGVQRYFSLFVNAMTEHGHEVIPCSVHLAIDAEVFKAAIKETQNDPTEGLPASVTRAQDAVVALVRAKRPDVLVLNGYSFANWLLFSAARIAGVPTVVSHHGIWYEEISTTAPPNAQQRMRDMERDSLLYATRNVYLNTSSASHMRRCYPNSERTDDAIIALPYNPEYLIGATAPSTAEARQLGFVGRWDPIKNIGLIRAFAQAHPEYTVTSPIAVGKRAALLHEEDAFRAAVNVIPPRDPDGMRAFYRGVRALILPSRFDVNPTVVLEAALQNRATVITPTVGWADAYRAHGLGALIAEPTVDSLAEAAAHAVAHPLPESFIQSLRESCSPERVFAQWNELLATL